MELWRRQNQLGEYAWYGAEFADRPSVACRLALVGIQGKTGVQKGVRIEYLKIKILYLQGLQDIFREVSPHLSENGFWMSYPKPVFRGN